MLQNAGQAIHGLEARRAQLVQKAQGGQKLLVPAGGLVQGLCVAADRGRVNALGGFGADAGVQGARPGKGRKIQGIDHQTGESHDVLDVGGVGVAQAAVFFEANARLVQLGFQVEGLIPGPEEHGDFPGRVTVQQIADQARGQYGLGQVVERADEARRRGALPAGI